MKKSVFIITALLLSSVLLVACAKSEMNEEGTPGALGTPSTGTSGELGTPVVGTTTEPMTGTTPLATSVAPGISTPVVGATEAVTTTVGGGSTLGSQQPDAGRVSNLLKFDVLDKNNEKIGSVSDLVINLDSGRVQYVIVNTGGLLGTGKEVAVPSALFDFPAMGIVPLPGTLGTPAGTTATPVAGAAITPSVPGENQNYLVFKADKAAFDNAPKWDKTLLPQFGQSAGDWDGTFSTYWKTYGTPGTTGGTIEPPVSGTPAIGTTPATGTTPAAPGLTLSGKIQGVVLASQVIGMNIVDASGNQIAEIKDIVIDTTNWKVLYLVIDYNGAGTTGGFYVPVPPAAFTLSTDGRSFTIVNADTVLAGAPHFTESDFPFTGTVGWDKDIQAYWAKNMTTNP